MLRDYIHFHKSVLDHWEIWIAPYVGTITPKVIRPWVIGARIKLVIEIAILKVRLAIINFRLSKYNNQ